MREDVGLSLRQEFEDAVETVEANTVTVRPHFPQDVMEKFHATEADLKNMATRYTGLKINGLADRAGYAVVHAARIELRDARILIDKTRKAETAEAQTYIKTCGAVAKYLTNIIAPVEDALDAEEAAYNAEVEAEKGRKQAEAAAKLQKRIEALQAVGHPINLPEITIMTDAQYGFVYEAAKEAWEVKEAARLEAEAKAKAFEEQQAREAAERAERERKEREEKEAAERAERERIQAEQAAERARLEKQAAELKAKQDEIERREREQLQREREEQIRKDTEAKVKAEAERKAREDQEAKERAAAAEMARQEAEAKTRAAAEAARPDAEKILALAKVVREIALPKLATDAGRASMTKIEGWVARLVGSIEAEAKALSPITPKAP